MFSFLWLTYEVINCFIGFLTVIKNTLGDFIVQWMNLIIKFFYSTN